MTGFNKTRQSQTTFTVKGGATVDKSGPQSVSDGAFVGKSQVTPPKLYRT